MRQAFSSRFLTWGIEVIRMELLDIKPRATVMMSMKTQMIAERDRRSQFIEAEGKKTATRIRSEGTKVVKQNEGLAQQETTRKISEGEAERRIELARAESQSLELVRSALQMYSKSQAKYMLAMRYLELLNTVGYVCKSKKIYLPYESDALSGSIATLNSIYGSSVKIHNRKVLEEKQEDGDGRENPIEVRREESEADLRIGSPPTAMNFDDLN